MKIIGIYKITSPNNRIYIGQSNDILRREKYYKAIRCKKQIRLYRSIIKYGWKNHIFEILEECKEENLNDRERYYQDLFNVLSKTGLDCKLTKTIDKSGKSSIYTINKLKKSLTGRKLSKIHCLNISEALKIRIRKKETYIKISNKRKGTKNNPISIEKMRQTKLSMNKISEKRKSIVQLDINNNYINTYPSIMECAIKLNIHKSNINKVLKGERKTVSNFKFILLAQYKQGELLENPTTVCEDNQQPSLSSDTFEGSTTNSQILNEDSNANTSALPSINNSTFKITFKKEWFNNGDDIV